MWLVNKDKIPWFQTLLILETSDNNVVHIHKRTLLNYLPKWLFIEKQLYQFNSMYNVHNSIISLQSCKPMEVKSWLAVSNMQKVKRQSRGFLQSISWGLVIVHTFILWNTVFHHTSTVYLFWEHFNNWTALQFFSSWNLRSLSTYRW